MTGELSKNFHGVGIGPLSKILAVKGIWPSFLVWSPPWKYASSVKNKQNFQFSNHLKTCQENVFLKLVLLRKFHRSTHCTGGLGIFATQLILALSKFCKAMPVFLLLLIEKDRKPIDKLQ